MKLGLLDAVVTGTGRVPVSVSFEMSKTIAGCQSPHSLRQHAGGLTTSAIRDALMEIAGAWDAEVVVSSGELAAMVRAAAATRQHTDREERIEVVMTGPSEPKAPVRSTESVAMKVIADARHHLLLVTYAAFPLPGVIRSLKTAAARGVEIRIVVETIAGSAGLLHVESAHAFPSIPGATFWHWPPERRGGPPQGRLHAKVMVADRAAAFVTSANLTGSAFESNLECGLLVHGGRVATRIVDHFDALIQAGTLRVLDPQL